MGASHPQTLSVDQHGSSSISVRAHALLLFHVSIKELILNKKYVLCMEVNACVSPPLGSGTSQVGSPSGQPRLSPGCRTGPCTLPTGARRCAECVPWRALLTSPPLSHSQPPALSQLVSLYLGRSHFLWKEPATMSWLEENVREVLQAVDSGDPAVEACESRWAWEPGRGGRGSTWPDGSSQE